MIIFFLLQLPPEPSYLPTHTHTIFLCLSQQKKKMKIKKALKSNKTNITKRGAHFVVANCSAT